MKEAFSAYDEAVKAGEYPSKEHSFAIDDDVINAIDPNFAMQEEARAI